MKQRVILSSFSLVVTIICNAVLMFAMFFNNPPAYIKIILGIVWGATVLASLFYMPLSISADKTAIYINRSLKIKAIPIQNVASVKICHPTMGAIRICGSGGFFGYWGWFRERDLGKYFAYYGKSSDCFLVELKNGRKYMLGCQNAPKMVQYIQSLLK